MMDAPLCIHCQHCSTDLGDYQLRAKLCVRPVGAAYSRVDGSPKRRLNVNCESERQGYRTLTGRFKCGPGGSCFTPIDLGTPPGPSK